MTDKERSSLFSIPGISNLKPRSFNPYAKEPSPQNTANTSPNDANSRPANKPGTNVANDTSKKDVGASKSNSDGKEKPKADRRLLDALLSEEIDGLLNLDDLDLTNEEVSFEGIEEEMKNIQKNTHIVKAMMDGTDLRQYTKENEEALINLEHGYVLDYLKEGDAIASLYKDIISCDTVLEQLDSLLSNFQTDIKNVGAEIKKLQDECLMHQMKLDNRAKVEQQLSKFIEQVSFSEEMQDFLMNGEVNEMYQEYLIEFNHKVSYIETQKAVERDDHLKAVIELEPVISTLQERSLNKVRHFMTNQFNMRFKDAETTKKHHKELLRFAPLYQFLFKNGPRTAEDIKIDYHDVISKLYYAYFKSYVATISRLTYEIANKNDLIGVEENKAINIFTGKRTIKHKASVFALGIRQGIIDNISTPSVIPIDSTEKKPFEALFKSMLYVLMEKVTQEIKFTQDFFLEMDIEMCDQIFSKILEIYNESVETYVENSYDAIAILTMIATIEKYRVIMERRLVSSLDQFFENAYHTLLNRFFFVFDLNIESVKNASAKDLSSVDLAQPHYVTRRYAEFNVSILYLAAISKEMGDLGFVKQVNQHLSKLREEMEKLLLRLAESKYRDWRSKTIFLMNNYDLIVSVQKERELISSDGTQIEKLLEMKLTDYVNDELGRPFARLLNFVKTYGPMAADYDTKAKDDSNDNSQSSAPAPKINVKQDEVEAIMKDFFTIYKQEVEKIKVNIMKQFSNLKFGMRIFEKIVRVLVDNYTSLVKFVKKYYKDLRKSKFFISETELQLELKKMIEFVE